MSLDQNLFTLQITPHKDYPNVVDLVDPSGTLHYRKQRVAGQEYKVQVYDPISESLLITATAPSPTSKTKILELNNPTQIVELKYTGTISFRWSFKWEEHEFEWKREECFMLRKPDPPVLVAVTKEPTGKLRTSTVQILDYNLNRFDINDRKGLEILILTALLTFSDSNEAYHTPAPITSPKPNPTHDNGRSTTSPEIPPQRPPKPAPKTGVDRIAELQAIRREYNEVTVEDEGSIEDYAQYCSNLLSDGAMLFVIVKSAEAVHVPKVLQVVEETKRIRHKSGIFEEEELNQYVSYDTRPEKKGPRRINLDDDARDKDKNKYVPPNSLTIHLSKIPMPELQPKAYHGDQTKTKKDNKKSTSPPSHAPANKSRSKGKPAKEVARSQSPPNTHSNKLAKSPQHSQSHSNLKAPQFPVASYGNGGVSNLQPSPSPRPYPTSSGAYSSSNSPPWAPPGGQSNQTKPNVVSSLFDKFHIR